MNPFILTQTPQVLSELCCNAEGEDELASTARDAVVSFTAQTERISAGICQAIYSSPVLCLKKELVSPLTTGAMLW